MTTRRTLSLLELDPDLGQLLTPERRELALATLQVEAHRLAAGPWSGTRIEGANPEHVGLLLLEGVVSREVVVSDTVSTELLGPGDILRPWTLQDTAPLLQLGVRWNALTESRVAVLDRRFAARLAQWPEVNSVLIDRLNARAQRLATTQAISQLNRVDRRLLALFWHLAERWGRVTSDGIAVPLTLSHRMLGQLVGARRPTVSTAIGDLAERDELVRRPDGTWLLRGEPVGLPTADAERIVPIRRKLMGRLDDEPVAAAETNGGGVAQPAEVDEPHEPVLATALAELRTTLSRLRLESEAQAGRLQQLTAESQRLQAQSLRQRDMLRAARERRATSSGGEPRS
jgi:CRP/FNR family transcriptional regulator, cyclic AMP receptor protein